jgi:predicted RNA-binding Zn-ribbon protein involved in translation (DUF1610 family)
MPAQFPCRSCGAKMEFQPGQALQCPYCGAQNEIPSSGEEIKELDFHAYLDQAGGQAETVEQQTVKCQACGAEQTLDPDISTSHCAFCGTTINAQAETHRTIKPASLLPFKVDKKTGMEHFRSWINGLWFAPNKLKQYATTEGALKGLYIPYWTYDANTFTWYDGERGDDYQDVEHYTEQDDKGNTVQKQRTVTRTRWHHVSGFVGNDFDDVLVLASWSLPREKTEALEPWDLENLESYQTEFLSGFQVEAYQVDLAQGFEHAKRIMQGEIESTIRRDIGGDHQRIHSTKSEYNNLTFKHILLPIWINAYRYQNKAYRFVVNGRTGEVQGERPWSVVKIALAVAGVLVAGGVIYYLARAFG